jgi:hypothetical protein
VGVSLEQYSSTEIVKNFINLCLLQVLAHGITSAKTLALSYKYRIMPVLKCNTDIIASISQV